jgi:uncharacterized LabA/DUF88 family protein
MITQFARAPHQSKQAQPPQTAPHAALLIDFDNVTMGIRSDITKELKNLLNSDIIKGKVAVQRAYADWRRYPQYVVPLAEASVDLIFAPAYGSSKKNATDIRLSIDALELVFTRPEIGTFILLSGDSDFSSLVLKLKEYGKYVVGVGIRESASDLLVQNCDEYYSYSALTGLTRAGEEEPARTTDPWELVEIAIQQMVSNADVMRSDRLKQVLLDLDPNFDEKQLGFSKFNRFVSEAANRGVIKIHKLENGQFELAPADTLPGEIAEEKVEEPKRSRGGRRRRGEGETREPRAAREPREAGPERIARPVAGTEPAAQRPRESVVTPAAEVPAERAPIAVQPAARSGDGRTEPAPQDIRASFDLLRRATSELGASHEHAVRDSDVKRRMRDLEPNWDESSLGFSKFSRFLRHAHDAEVINLRKIENGSYEVALPAGTLKTPPLAAAATEPAAMAAERAAETRRAGRGRRGRGEGRERAPKPQLAMPEVAAHPKAPAEALQQAGPEQMIETARAMPGAMGRPPERKPEAGAAKPAGAAPASPVLSMGPRRGSKSPRITVPPPLLAGQAIPRQPAAAPPAETVSQTVAAAAAQRAPDRLARTDSTNRTGLPVERQAVIDYLTRSYKGVGGKTAESLVDAVGADHVFDTLHNAPDRVKQILGARRGGALVEAWRADFRARSEASPGMDVTTARADSNAATENDAPESGRNSGRSSRGRRGGRRRGGRVRKRVPAEEG